MAKRWDVLVRWGGATTFNPLNNPSFETDLSSWSTLGTWATNTRVSTHQQFGSWSNKLVNSSGSRAYRYTTYTALATVGTVSIWVYREAGAALIRLGFEQDFAPFTRLTSTQLDTTTGIWQRLTATATGLTPGNDYRLVVESDSGNTLYIDGAQAEDSAVATPYYDSFWGDESGELMEIHVERGRKSVVRSGGNGFSPQDIGEATLTMRNVDGRYDIFNSASPLYLVVEPGREVIIRLTDGTRYNIFRGHIYDIKPIGNAQSRRVQLIVRDGWQWLKDRKVTSAPQANILTDTAMGTLATAAAYPFGTDIYQGVDTISYWWAENRDAMSQIQSLMDSEFGLVWVGVDGILYYRRRPYQWLIGSSVTFESDDLSELNFAQPWDVVRNVIQIKVYPTDIITNQIIWANTKAFKIRPGKSITLNAKYTYDGNPTSAFSIVTTLNAWSGASGTSDNLTAQIGVSVSAKGEEASITLTNNTSPARIAYIRSLQLNGTVINRTDAVTVESDSSGGATRRTFLLDVPWQQDVEKSQEYAVYLAGLLNRARGNPVFRSNRDVAKQCLELNTVLTLDITALELNSTYRVEGISHHWNAQSPNVLDTRMYCGTTDESEYWTLNTSQFDDETVLAY